MKIGKGEEAWNETCFFGLQYFIKKYLKDIVIKDLEQINKMKEFVDGHVSPGMFPLDDWNAILKGSQAYQKFLYLEIYFVNYSFFKNLNLIFYNFKL